MINSLIIIGAGGHGKVIAESAEACGIYDQIYFLDDKYASKDKISEIYGWKVIGSIDSFHEHIETSHFIVGIGNNSRRIHIQKTLEDANAKIACVIHPTAIVSQYCTIEPGTCVLPGAIINIGTAIGKGCIINSGACIEHDCCIDQGVHISPNVSIAGGVKVGNGSWLGIGCSVIELIEIPANCIVGAGSTVIKSPVVAGTYVGSPAHLI